MTAIHYELEGSTAVVRMDDGKANALSETMIGELIAALTRAEGEAKAVVLTGRPERFCAGFDLKAMMASPESARNLLRKGSDMFLRLYSSPLPVVMACTGHAMAGGALLLLTGDVRIGAEGAFRLGLNEVSIGMPLPILGVELVRDRIAKLEIGRAVLGAQIYDPTEAVRAGYLDSVVAPADVLPKAKEEAMRLGAFSRMAYHGTKMRIRKQTIDRISGTFDADMATIAIGG